MTTVEDSSADLFIVCQGDSNIQVRAISDKIQRRTREDLNIKALHVEGAREAQWILLDYFNVVVHIFYPDKRAYYDLESLWSDARFTYYDNL